MNFRWFLASFLLALAGCNSDSGSSSASAPPNPAPGPEPLPRLADQAEAQCLINSSQREIIGPSTDISGPLEVTVNAPVGTPFECSDNQAYQLGSGIYDITGPVADTASLAWVNPQQVFRALHTRVYARAFAIASPCNGKRIMFVSLDTGLMSKEVREAVLAEIAADEALKDLYNAHNVMLSVTHTHSDPGTGLAGVGNGKAVIVGGTVAAIRQAHVNLTANPETGRLTLSDGELLHTNINRSKPAFAMNPETERAQFPNDVNKRMVQLELNRGDTAVGLINWFGVHPTVIGPDQHYVSGDVKGYASLGFEELMGTDYRADPALGTFVGAFAQADEGDASPNIAIEVYPYPSARRGGGENDLDSNAISGIKQLARAIELYGTGKPVSGPVDYRFLTIPITAITVEDPTVLASLKHPAELDDAVKQTCDGILGASFGAGAEDGPGPTTEGLTCSDDPDLLNAALKDINTLTGTRLEGFPGGWPAETIPGEILSATVMCNAQDIAIGNFACQAEKPVLLPRGGDQLPIQLFRVGNFALLGLPWEVTTMSARRIRSLLLEVLAPAGVDTLVIAGLVNDYVHYLTTREEYASQQYEGASTLYGPWTQAAVAQESLKLARAMASGEALGAIPATGPRSDLSFAPGPIEFPHPDGAPGTITVQPASSVTAGETVTATLVVGHPGNDLRIQKSYVYVERQLANGEWQVVEEDRSPNLIYEWQPLIQPPLALEGPLTSTGGTALINWQVPANTDTGVFRLRVAGATRNSPAPEATPYEVVTDQFTVLGSADECP